MDAPNTCPIKLQKELYMERLQKWREEKQKKNVKDKNNTHKCVNQNTVVSTSSKNLPQPLKTKPQGTTCKPHVLNPSIKRPITVANRNVRAFSVPQKSVVQAIKPKPVRPTPNLSQKEPAKEYLQKYQLWKEEKEKTRSEKKLNPGSSRSTVKPTVTQHLAKSTDKPVRAKSRLFDFMNHNKINGEKENKTISKIREGLTQAKTERAVAVKRRRSFSSHGPPAKRNPVGILKRKSCAGSFDFDMKVNDTKLNTEVKRKSEADQLDVCPISPKTPSRNVRFISPDCSGSSRGTDGKVVRKTPVKRQNLNDWLESNNKTPSKFRHLLCFHADHEHDPAKDLLAKSFLSIEELADQANALKMERLIAEAKLKLESMLEECMTLFEAGCPREAILPWLDDIYNKIPIARASVSFYKCKVDVLKETLDLDAVLQIFEEATINDAQPKTELAKMLTETLKYVTDKKVKLATKAHRKRRYSEVQEENVFASSAIVYTMENATPFSNRKQKQDRDKQTDDCQVVTPVRRSTRRSLQNLPESLKEKRRTLTSLTDLEDKENVLLKRNLALEKDDEEKE